MALISSLVIRHSLPREILTSASCGGSAGLVYAQVHINWFVRFSNWRFGLLTDTGQLGYIVSNAFAKREFGVPLVDFLLQETYVQKVIDCSGLLFPGHGTPTCLLFRANSAPLSNATVRNVVILPGGGDLRTPPEE